MHLHTICDKFFMHANNLTDHKLTHTIKNIIFGACLSLEMNQYLRWQMHIAPLLCRILIVVL